MNTLSELSLRRTHAGEAQRAYSLNIDGEPFTNQVRSLKGTFDPKIGGSVLTIDVRESLEGLEDASVTLSLGYGDILVPYFIGRLQEPADLAGGQGAAYGPFKLQADQAFGETVTYQGVNLRYIFQDLDRRAGYGSGVLEVVGGEYVVEHLGYTEETKLGEAAKAIADPAKYVIYDRPGGKRRVMPIPKPGSTGKAKVSIAEHNYGVDGFQITENREGYYSKVVVFRRDSAGNNLVREEAPVPNRGKFKPPANRIFYVPEFPGNAAAANQTAYETANRLAYGERGFKLSKLWINPELEPWDFITVERTERRSKRQSADGKPGKWLVTYQCLIDSEFGFEIDPSNHYMNLGGGAVELTKIRQYDPITINLNKLSAGVIVAPPLAGLQPDINLQPDIDLQPDGVHFT